MHKYSHKMFNLLKVLINFQNKVESYFLILIIYFFIPTCYGSILGPLLCHRMRVHNIGDTNEVIELCDNM
jgi:hypothetical protein